MIRRTNSRVVPCFLAALMLVTLNPAMAASAASACNNQTRTLAIKAGTEQTTTECAQFTINVAGVGLTTPKNCPNSRTERDEDTWTCGPKSTGTHCTADAYKVNVKMYKSDSPCPTLPDSIPDTLKEARALIQCKTLPLVKEFTVKSATIRSCADGTYSMAPRTPGEFVVNGYDSFMVHLGDPDALLGGPRGNQVLAKLEALETNGPDKLPPGLMEVYLQHGAVPGIKNLSATVTLEFAHVDGYGPVTREHNIQGMVMGDGRFTISDTRIVEDEDGGQDLAVEELSHDGASLFQGHVGADYYNVWSSESSTIDDAFYNVQYLDPIILWIESPFLISLIPGTRYASEITTEPGGEEVLRVDESYPQVTIEGGNTGTTSYFLSLDEVAHPLRIENRDSQGTLSRQTEFADYRTLDNGQWRPATVVESYYQDGESEPYLIVTTRLNTAQVMSEEEAEAAPPRIQSEENLWFVRLD